MRISTIPTKHFYDAAKTLRGIVEMFVGIAQMFVRCIEADLGASHPLGFQFAGKPEAMPWFDQRTYLIIIPPPPLSLR